MGEFSPSPEANKPTKEQIHRTILDALDSFASGTPEDQDDLEHVLLPELSEALGEELDLSSNSLGRLRDLAEEYRLNLE